MPFGLPVEPLVQSMKDTSLSAARARPSFSAPCAAVGRTAVPACSGSVNWTHPPSCSVSKASSSAAWFTSSSARMTVTSGAHSDSTSGASVRTALHPPNSRSIRSSCASRCSEKALRLHATARRSDKASKHATITRVGNRTTPTMSPSATPTPIASSRALTLCEIDTN
eukprot:6105634-Pleurochrysis_carterae.AAC.1